MESLNFWKRHSLKKGLADTMVIKLFQHQQRAFKAELSGSKIDEKILKEV